LHDINRKVFNKSQFHPRFVRQYADLNSVIEQKLPRQYVADVRQPDFPSPDESY